MVATIAAADVVKTYRVGVGHARVHEMVPAPFDVALARTLPDWWRRDTFSALDGVSFEIEKGTAAGLIGHNGIDESDHELGASISPEMGFEGSTGIVRWHTEDLALRPGVYFPVVCVLSSQARSWTAGSSTASSCSRWAAPETSEPSSARQISWAPGRTGEAGLRVRINLDPVR